MPAQIFIYTALPSEAKPLVEHFGLKKNIGIQPFAVYSNRNICLTVTGIGKSAMAAGVAYSHALLASTEHPVLINIGIAGHKDHAIGKLFLIDKIIDADTGKAYYPPLVSTPPCPSAGLQTFSKPQLCYDSQFLCDMEASAFYESAVRFTSSELIQCLKVISDNESSPAENIDPKQASALIAGRIEEVEAAIEELNRLAELVTFKETPELFHQLTQHYHFTVSEQGQLKNLLSRWAALTGNRAIEFDSSQFNSSKEVLFWLDRQIDKLDFVL